MIDSLEQAFYDADNETNVLRGGAGMVAIVLVALWFVAVCLHLIRQQWSGEISGYDA